MRKIIKWIKKLIWWRFYYTKTKLTTEEANRGRCLLCHASIRVHQNDKSRISLQGSTRVSTVGGIATTFLLIFFRIF